MSVGEHVIELINAKIGKLLLIGSGGLAAVGSSVPTHSFGSYLTSNGAWLLSYAEMMQIAAFIWVCILIVGSVIKAGKWLKIAIQGLLK